MATGKSIPMESNVKITNLIAAVNMFAVVNFYITHSFKLYTSLNLCIIKEVAALSDGSRELSTRRHTQ